jgi:methylated-DNA-[protein]-cysteine S-methyltransferase
LVWVARIEFMSSLQAVRIIETPLGQIAIGATDLGVSDVEIMVSGNSRREFAESEMANSHVQNAASQLEEYFSGSRRSFDVKFDLSGTDFQKAVWGQIHAVGFGEDVSYGDIAKKLGKPSASRAVGGAVGANPVPLFIGCHRILGSSRRLTGYSGGGGLKTKLWLLEHEQISYR